MWTHKLLLFAITCALLSSNALSTAQATYHVFTDGNGNDHMVSTDGKPVKNKGYSWMKSIRLRRVTKTSTSSRTSISTTTSGKSSVKTEKVAREMKQEEKRLHETVKKTEEALKQLKKDVKNHRNNKTKEDIERLETALKQLKEEESKLKKTNKETIKEIKK